MKESGNRGGLVGGFGISKGSATKNWNRVLSEKLGSCCDSSCMEIQ